PEANRFERGGDAGEDRTDAERSALQPNRANPLGSCGTRFAAADSRQSVHPGAEGSDRCAPATASAAVRQAGASAPRYGEAVARGPDRRSEVAGRNREGHRLDQKRLSRRQSARGDDVTRAGAAETRGARAEPQSD